MSGSGRLMAIAKTYQDTCEDTSSIGKGFFGRLFSQKLFWLTMLLLPLLFAGLMQLMATPAYRATSILLINVQAEEVNPKIGNSQTPPQHARGSANSPDTLFQTQYRQLRSRDLAGRVIASLSLDDRLFQKDFSTPLTGSIRKQYDHMLEPVKAWAVHHFPGAFVKNTDSRGKHQLVKRFLEKLSVEPIGDSRLVRVSYDSPDPRLSASIVNTLVHLFIKDTISRKSGAESGAYIIRDKALGRARTRLADRDSVRIIDKATTPAMAYYPDFKKNILLSLIAALCLAVVFALFRGSRSKSLTSCRTLEKLSGLPILGTIPYVGRKNQQGLSFSVIRDIGSPVSEAYRIAATNLKYIAIESGARIFLVTSINPEEGKSTSAVNLALGKAQIGNKVLLIDADLRRPTLHTKMDLNNHLGLSEYLHGDIELSKATQHFAEAKNMFVITAGILNLDPVEALSCDRMNKLMAMARQYFDVTIIDAPPVKGFADALLLAGHADATVMVTQEENIDREQMSQALVSLQRIKQNIIAGFLVVKAKEVEIAEQYYRRYTQRTTLSDEPLGAGSLYKKGGLNLAR